ncbi:hypothetical protein RND81_14G025900 [Saponaria officinalis]|uniref:Uncharacterized protein n=1 Tax=Saponaria officinalis TaxID=3572 RepID=A0AAW1GIH3_SAPOF
MVLPLGPGKFYGTSLPRPRFYTDVKFSDERVDPPTPVNDALLSWANEAHWSMGGLSLKRIRLQGKIEGNVEKLRKEREKIMKNTPKKRSLDSPPPAPVSKKLRSRMVGAEDKDKDEDEKVEEIGGVRRKRRRLVRKLGNEFEMVADENQKSDKSAVNVGPKNRRRKMVLVEEEDAIDAEITEEVSGKNVKGVSPNGKRSSSRLKKKSN